MFAAYLPNTNVKKVESRKCNCYAGNIGDVESVWWYKF